MIVVSSAVKEARLAVCHGCENYRSGVCQACGCLLTMKAALKHADCPRGKWMATDEADVTATQAPASRRMETVNGAATLSLL